jgi:hypothetical protein
MTPIFRHLVVIPAPSPFVGPPAGRKCLRFVVVKENAGSLFSVYELKAAGCSSWIWDGGIMTQDLIGPVNLSLELDSSIRSCFASSDDGHWPGYSTNKLLEILNSFDVKSNFFILSSSNLIFY